MPTTGLHIVPIRRALLSVSDKTGVVEFAQYLADHNVQLISTGGTATAIRNAGIPARDVSEVTNFPEVFDGRVKTLHPSIHGGLLFKRDDPQHVQKAVMLGILPIDLLVVNLYPFEATVAKKNVTFEEAIENIDIGGPAMIRGAAKNHAHVAVVTHPMQYDLVRDQMNTFDGTTRHLRESLLQEAFRMTAAYDAAITSYLQKVLGTRATIEPVAG